MSAKLIMKQLFHVSLALLNCLAAIGISTTATT